MKLDPQRATLVVIDVQEAFRKALPTFDEVAAASATLVEGATAVGIPVVVTEQYPKGLGATVPEVAEHLPADVDPLAKVRFSAAEADGFRHVFANNPNIGGRYSALSYFGLVPAALVGGAGGPLSGGRHVRYPDRTPLSNLLLTMLDRAHVPVESIGDSTGVCSEI